MHLKTNICTYLHLPGFDQLGNVDNRIKFWHNCLVTNSTKYLSLTKNISRGHSFMRDSKINIFLLGWSPLNPMNTWGVCVSMVIGHCYVCGTICRPQSHFIAVPHPAWGLVTYHYPPVTPGTIARRKMWILTLSDSESQKAEIIMEWEARGMGPSQIKGAIIIIDLCTIAMQRALCYSSFARPPLG